MTNLTNAPEILEDAGQMEEALHKFELDFKIVLNNIPAVVFKGYADGSVDFLDHKVERMTGFPLSDFASRRLKWTDLILEEDKPETRKIFLQALKTKRSYVREYRIKNTEGQIIWIHERSYIVCHEDGKINYVSGIFFDITDRKHLEERVAERTAQLHEANERLTLWAKELEQRNREIKLLSQLGDLLQSCRTLEEAYPVIEQALGQFFPADSGALCVFSLSRNVVEAVAVWGENPPLERIFIIDDCWALRRGRPYFAEESRAGLRCRHVEDPTAVYLCVPMMAHGEALGLLHVLVGLEETSKLETKQALAFSVAEHMALALATLKLQESLRHLSVRDSLTDLYNRRYMEESLARELRRAQRQSTPIGIIMLDIDHFKRVNDNFGHETGDAVLREMAKFLKKYIRSSDIACRYGGEEFALILPGSSLDTTRKRAEKLREDVKHLRIQHGGQLLDPFTVSLGVATFPEHGDTGLAVLQAADVAMYQAKQAGRDQVWVAGNLV